MTRMNSSERVTKIPLVTYPNDEGLLKAPDIEVQGKRLRGMVIDQAHSILAHLGAKKTVSYIREFLWWDSMVKDVTQFCTSCTTCQRSKPPTHKPFGLLNPLPVPSRPWDAIGVDFVGPLPESRWYTSYLAGLPTLLER